MYQLCLLLLLCIASCASAQPSWEILRSESFEPEEENRNDDGGTGTSLFAKKNINNKPKNSRQPGTSSLRFGKGKQVKTNWVTPIVNFETIEISFYSKKAESFTVQRMFNGEKQWTDVESVITEDTEDPTWKINTAAVDNPSKNKIKFRIKNTDVNKPSFLDEISVKGLVPEEQEEEEENDDEEEENFTECVVLKHSIQYEDKKESRKNTNIICSCKNENGVIVDLTDLSPEMCGGLTSTTSILNSSNGFILNVATQEAHLPVGAFLQTTTINQEEEDELIGIGVTGGKRRRRLAQFGDRKVLILRAKASDGETTSSEAKLKEEILGIGGTDQVNLASQFSACSYGQLTFSPSTLGNNGAYTVDIANNIAGSSDSVIRNAMYNQASADLGSLQSSVDAGVIDNVIFCIPPGTSGNWIAYAYINFYISVYNDRWCEYPSSLMHEIGHNLGLSHSGENSNEYGDQSGMMGYSYGSDEGPYMCFNGVKTFQLGWFQQYHQTVTSSDPFNWQGSLIGFVDRDDAEECEEGDVNCDTLIFKLVPQSGNDDYYVHFNRRDGFNSGTREGGNQVMVVKRPKNTGYANSFLEAKLGNNGQFKIPAFGNDGDLTLNVNSITPNGNSYADVTIQYGDAPPTDIPSASPSSSPSVGVTEEDPDDDEEEDNISSAYPSSSPSVAVTEDDEDEELTNSPTFHLSSFPTSSPSVSPSFSPSFSPSATITASPIDDPTSSPTGTPQGIAITNARSGRRLYAQSNRSGESGFGGGVGTFYADQRWHFRLTECGAGACSPEEGGGPCFHIENKYSGRRIYAQNNKDWESGVGAVSANSNYNQDQKWMMEVTDCDSDDTCYIIRNIHSCRRLYAQSDRTWESGVGADDGATVYSDQKWIVDLAQYYVPEPTPAPTLYSNGRCLGSFDFNLDETGCTYETIVNKLDGILHGGCPHSAEEELRMILGATSIADTEVKLKEVCENAWEDLSVPFSDIDSDFSDEFMNQYFKGETYLNTETGSFQDTEVGNNIDNFRNGAGENYLLKATSGLENCSVQSILCCFGRDRQPNDNNGNCANPLDSKCVNATPADNTNLCFTNYNDELQLFPGETEADKHCHGLAWADDEYDLTYLLRFNNLFYVSLYDHMYTRGYAEAMVDDEDLPMCGCIEDMPPVSRADCTEISASLEFTVSTDENGGFNIESDLEVEYNACQGTNPANGQNKNNDLASYVRRLKNRGKVQQSTEDAVFDVLVGYDNVNNNENEASCKRAYEEAGGTDYPAGIAIQNARSGRRLYAQDNRNGESGFGGGVGPFYDDQKWHLREVECGEGACAGEGPCFWIVNAHSGRRIYAQNNRDWESGVGAVTANSRAYQDQKWALEITDCDSDDTCYIIRNIHSCRRLYAQSDRTWGNGVGADDGATVYSDQKWIVDLAGGIYEKF